MSKTISSSFIQNNPNIIRIMIIIFASLIAIYIGYRVGKPIGRLVYNLLH
jgi:putative Mn2+ efflux pump MntP